MFGSVDHGARIGNYERFLQPTEPRLRKQRGLSGNGFGEARLARGDAMLEEAAGGQEFGVEEGGTGGAADQIVREQGEFDVEQGAFADAADNSGHAVARVEIAAGLGAIFFVQDDDGIFKGGREGGQFGVDLEVAQGFADFVEGGAFYQAEGDTFEVAVDDRDAIAVGANAEAGVNETRAIPFAKKFLRLGFHFFFFTADGGDDV